MFARIALALVFVACGLAQAESCNQPLGTALGKAQWNGWGNDPTQRRFQSAASADLTAKTVPGLKLKWAFGFPDATAAWSQPVVVGGRLFVGSQNGHLYPIDAKTGCTHWVSTASAAVRRM